MKIDKSKVKKNAEVIAKKYVELHNTAGQEMKKEFVSVKAKMWNDDEMQPLDKKNVKYITDQLNTNPAMLEVVYERPVSQPLTVMDSYPNVLHQQKRKVATASSKIVKKYNKQFRDFLSKL